MESEPESEKGGARPQPHWAWALVMVGALHLASSPGQPVIGDHAEMILMSQRLLGSGTFTLAEVGQAPLGLAWDPPRKPRFYPGTAVALLPFVALDRILGWDRPLQAGRLVQFAGHAFVLAALALLGAAIRRFGGSSAGAALAIVLVGSCWPVWQIARNSGAEPVLMCLAALFLWGSAADSAKVRFTAALLLPWVHPTGVILAAALGSVDLRSGNRWIGKTQAAQLAATIASAAVAFVAWNLVFHGAASGGYTGHVGRAWLRVHPWREFVDAYLPQYALMVPIVVLPALAAGWRGQAAGRRRLLSAIVVVAAMNAFFLVFTPLGAADQVRRLSIAWLGFGLVLGLGSSKPSGAREGHWHLNLAVASITLGFYWFQLLEWNQYVYPGGPIGPTTLWITWWQRGWPAWVWVGSLTGLCALFAYAAWQVSVLWLRAGRASVGVDR